MTPLRIVGLVLIAFGLAALLYGGVFWKERDTVLDAGPIQVTAEKHKGVAVPPIAGAIAIVAGVVLLLIPRRHGA